MNKTKTQPMTTKELLTRAQQLANTNFFPALAPSKPVSLEEIKERLEMHNATVDRLAVPFTIYKNNLSQAQSQPVHWLWQKRLPTAGITLLDGDHACGKTLLALQIAASVSSGTPMPDGTPSSQGGVVIVSPNADATTTQLQVLSALGADLSRIEILSFIQEDAPEFYTGGYRPFSLPEDFLSLHRALDRVNARLLIFDPFINLLGHSHRWTDLCLRHLLTNLNQRLIERDMACLLIRNCGAKGKNAKPSALEQSDHFFTIAISRLLLAPDPMQPNHPRVAQRDSHCPKR